MPIDYYFGKTIVQLEKLLATVQDRQAKGGMRDITVSGIRTRREFDPEQNSLLEIERLRYSLFLRAQQTDPSDQNRDAIIAKYPNPFRERITKTRPDYRRFANSQ
jgi:hypothetical protein